MNQIFSFYNNLIGGLSPATQGIISLIVAVAIIYFAYSFVRKNLLIFVIVLIVFFPIIWPALVAVWKYLVIILKFLISHK